MHIKGLFHSNAVCGRRLLSEMLCSENAKILASAQSKRSYVKGFALKTA